MLTAEQFVVRSTDRAAWLGARSLGVTATTVAKAATPSGFAAVMAGEHESIEDNEYMAYGREREPVIAAWAQRNLGLVPNDWLIRSALDPRRLATPDALDVSYSTIGEYKTTGDPWDRAFKGDHVGIPIQYRRQVQWELLVTGAWACWLVWEQRVPDQRGWFYCPWLEPRWTLIKADEKMQAELIKVADKLMTSGYGF